MMTYFKYGSTDNTGRPSHSKRGFMETTEESHLNLFIDFFSCLLIILGALADKIVAQDLP